MDKARRHLDMNQREPFKMTGLMANGDQKSVMAVLEMGHG